MKILAYIRMNDCDTLISNVEAFDKSVNSPLEWEIIKKNLVSFHPDPEKRVKVYFREGRGFDKRRSSHFYYRNGQGANSSSGGPETFEHMLIIECLNRADALHFDVGDGKKFSVYPTKSETTTRIPVNENRFLIPDVLVNFEASIPEFLPKSWDNRLALEVFATHRVDALKIHDLKTINLTCLELNVKQFRIPNNLETAKEILNYIDKMSKKLSDPNSGRIKGKLLVNSIKEEYKVNFDLWNMKIENDKLKEEISESQKEIKSLETKTKKQEIAIHQLSLQNSKLSETCENHKELQEKYFEQQREIDIKNTQIRQYQQEENEQSSKGCLILFILMLLCSIAASISPVFRNALFWFIVVGIFIIIYNG